MKVRDCDVLAQSSTYYKQWNSFLVIYHVTNWRFVLAIQTGNLRLRFFSISITLRIFTFSLMERISRFLWGLEALLASLLLRFGAIITVNKGFLNKNTAITRLLIRTARTLEAKFWQVCREAWLRWQKEMSQVLGLFGLLDFTMLWSVLAWRAFWNLWTVHFFNFPIFFQATVNRG
jgi:hypothetical protein